MQHRNQFWFITVTVSTLGYGDMLPETELGRAVAAATLLLGFILTSLLLAVFSRFILLRSNEQRAVVCA